MKVRLVIDVNASLVLLRLNTSTHANNLFRKPLPLTLNFRKETEYNSAERRNNKNSVSQKYGWQTTHNSGITSRIFSFSLCV